MRLHFLIVFLVCICLEFSRAESWKKSAPGGSIPQERYGHTMILKYDKAYLFGGQNGTNFFNDLWTFKPSEVKFTQENPGNPLPSARYGHSAVVYNNKMYIFFGRGESAILSDVWSYDLSSKTWTEEIQSTTKPAARYDHRTVLIGTKIWLYGGRTNVTALSDVWEYDPSNGNWTQQYSQNAWPRYGHSMIASGTDFYVYGGKNVGLLANGLKYDTTNNTWTVLNMTNPPSARAYCLTVNSNTGMWIAGGIVNTRTETESDDLWYFHLADYKWTELKRGPYISNSAGVMLPKSVRDDSKIEIYLFGGQQDNIPLRETWKYDSTQDNDDDDGDDGHSHSISCGTTGIEIFLFFAAVAFLRALKVRRK